MVAKLGPLNKKSLGDAEVETIELKDIKPCEHKFTYKSAGEIICVKCNAGFFIRADEHLQNGRLVSGGKLVI